MRRAVMLLGALALAMAGCFQKASNLEVPRDTAQQCAKHCERLDMRLGAVVIIMTSAGCVCEPRAPSAVRKGGSGAVAGGAAIHAAAEAARRANQQRQASH